MPLDEGTADAMAASTYDRARRAGTAQPRIRAASAAPARLLTVSNRLPVTVTLGADGPAITPSAGGLATALTGPHDRTRGLWIGWSGVATEDAEPWRGLLDDELAARRLVPVPLSAREVTMFYEGISNEVLWAICHDRLDQLPLRMDGWEEYEAVNARFADVVASHYQPGDAIWVHDYQLMRLPALLRERLPGARIGFFLHVPFPNPEIFFTLPTRRWLVDGMLGADVIGFHTRRYRGHFTAALRRLLGVEAEPDGTVAIGERRIRLGVYPVGVDASAFARRAASPAVIATAHAQRAPEERLLVGVDRLDYSKGIPRRLLALEQLFLRHPEWKERVRLVQVAVPSRTAVGAYRRLRREVDGLVGRINGALSTPRWSPIHYLYRNVPDEMLLALYRAADVMVVTPVRDGMNLVAKEFVASRTDDDGVLVLSEFAGAASELTDALIVNPYDVDGTADALHQALTMDEAERGARMRALRTTVMANDAAHWVATFVRDLEGVPA